MSARRFHLHFEIPAICHLAHVERQKRVAANRAEGAHIGIAEAVEQPDYCADYSSRCKLVPGHGTGFTPAARP